MPAERFDLGSKWREVQDIRGGTGLLVAILVDNRCEVTDLVLVGRGDRLPDLSLTHFAVSENDKNPGVEAVDPTPQGLAKPNGKSLAE